MTLYCDDEREGAMGGSGYMWTGSQPPRLPVSHKVLQSQPYAVYRIERSHVRIGKIVYLMLLTGGIHP